MARRIALALVGSTIVSLTLAACADRATSVDGPDVAATSAGPTFDKGGNDDKGDKDKGYKDSDNSPDRKIHYLKGDKANDEAKLRGGGGGTGIYYHGGPVLLSTNVAAVYWAGTTIYNGGPTPGTYGTPSVDGSLVGYFLSHLGGSPYFNINTTYTNGSGTHINNVVNYTQYWANNTNVPGNGQSVSDAQMVAMLQSGFNSGALTYDPNTLYAIFTAGTVNLGGGFGTQYCAYHTHGTVNIPNLGTRTVLYAAMPYDYAYPSACAAQTVTPNGDPGADSEVNTLAHETEETTTDMMGTAWYDTRGYENADKCAWTWGSYSRAPNGSAYNMTLGTKNFLVQQNWVNSGSGGCALKW